MEVEELDERGNSLGTTFVPIIEVRDFGWVRVRVRVRG